MSEPRLWHFKTIVYPYANEYNWEWSNPVLVYSGQRLIGCASVYIDANRVLCEGILDYATPERLDVENGLKAWLLPRITVKPSSMRLFKGEGGLVERIAVKVDHLELRADCDNPEMPPIGTPIL